MIGGPCDGLALTVASLLLGRLQQGATAPCAVRVTHGGWLDYRFHVQDGQRHATTYVTAELLQDAYSLEMVSDLLWRRLGERQ